MRNLNQELKDIGLDAFQRESVLNWLNTLSSEDLNDNGNENLYFPPGYGDVTPPDPYGIDRSLPYRIQEKLRTEKRIEEWIEKNLPIFKEMDKNPNESGRIQFVKGIKKEFNFTLVEAKEYLDKNWYK